MLDAQTIPELVFKILPHFNKRDCLKTKKGGVYADISADEVIQTVEALSARLIDMGVRKGDRVGLLAENRAEWAYADLAILCAGAVTVPVYSTLPAKQVEYILNNSAMEIIFVSTETQWKKIMEIRKETPRIKKIIVMDVFAQKDDLTSDVATLLAEGKEVLKKNPEMVRNRSAESRKDEVFSIIYTSGTTGEPKGVMLTHGNILSNVESIQTVFTFTREDIALSFLPLSHIFERMAGYYTMLYYGCTIAYAESVEAMPKNLGEVRPTILISVPRVYEKFYQRITDNVAAEHGLKKKIATWGLDVAARYTEAKLGTGSVPAGLSLQYSIADALLYKKIRGRLGGRLRLMISGGAALPRQLAHFFYGLGMTIIEGYGLSETSPVIACNRPGKIKFGTVGLPVPGVEVKIAEDGEILTRGPHVMKGYYEKPKETAEVMTADGFFRTGDIGELDADGFLRITDRKKDLIVTSGGKNVAPQFVENTLKSSKYIVQIVVVGDKRKFPVALVVPNMDHLKKFAAANNIAESEILTNRAVVSEVMRDLDARSKDLASFERVKKIALLGREFTIEDGEMTPSLKIKRNVVEKKYKDLIDGLYADAVME